MKKLTILLALAISVSFASCKKDYTCDCTYKVTYSYSGVTSSEEGSISKSIKDTKKKAQSECDDYESALKSQYDASAAISGATVTSSSSCNLVKK